MKYQLDRLLVLTHRAIFMVTSISPEISNYCCLQLLSPTVEGVKVVKYHPLPRKTYSAYRGSKDNLSAWDWEAEHYFLTSRQNEYLSWLLANEWAWRYLLYGLKVIYLGRLLTDQETCLFWSAVQKGYVLMGWINPSVGCNTTFSMCCTNLVWSILNGVSHDGFVPQVSFPSQDQTQ